MCVEPPPPPAAVAPASTQPASDNDDDDFSGCYFAVCEICFSVFLGFCSTANALAATAAVHICRLELSFDATCIKERFKMDFV